ncbi:pyridoxamine 5'-phosphate oxidase family protein [Natronomonas gomsonensis]|uniref:pyridoxamine 5'-phosphate oxidase family protein n=1 Tax=Natronomonas gomsonensis TaxID=1046043 RepID=UPI0015B81E75|nr:pyridoxamine 5'-phosphate oxidase family protein [Natronomonas gomsonensis]
MADTSTTTTPVTSSEKERIRQAVHDSAAAEVATANGDRPQTFPLSPFYDETTESVVVTSPPAFSGKVDAVQENPKLSLLFYDAEEPFILYGRGTVRDDDLEANAEYVRKLIEDEPPSPKREGFSKTTDVLESRIGRFLLGWYALRIVVEIEPVRIEPVGIEVGEFPPWPATDLDRGEAESYDRLAFTVVDEDGWPTTRTVEGVEIRDDVALVDVPLSVDDGSPACLLCHWHSSGLDKLSQRLYRGQCRTEGDRVVFDPASSFSMRNETLWDRLKFIVQGKWRTRRYFRD